MDLAIVIAIVATAAAYAAAKLWGLLRPGPKTTGCGGCSSARGGCSGCPLSNPRHESRR